MAKDRIIPFTKMHGLGNDFVMVNKIHVIDLDVSSLAKEMSDRRLGIGCDQFIIYSTANDMEIYNQDGSLAKACGNASRCLIKLIFLETGNQNTKLHVYGKKIEGLVHDDGKVSVNMGAVSFNESWMPKQSHLFELANRYNIDPKGIICADIGNPHIVIFASLTGEDQRVIGSQLQHSGLFPDGVNVNFARMQNRCIDLSVWERGVGFTLACGSGAASTFASAAYLGLVDLEADVIFKLGTLKMTINENNEIVMNGEATLVCKGNYYAQ